MIEYNEENLKLVSDLIVKNLTPDLIPVKWRQRNSVNPMFGHCHTAVGLFTESFYNKRTKTLSSSRPTRYMALVGS